MTKWSLYESENEKFLKPLVFSNSKSQEDIVHEVLQSVKDGCKVIFIHGVCGSGKSAVALNLAKALGKASIVVPVKSLQKQYENDYTNKKFLLKNNGEKLKIKVITGRQNFSCPYLQEFGLPEIDSISSNAKLDIFSSSKQNKAQINKDSEKIENSCDNSQIPCTIEIKRANIKRIKEYMKRNKKVKIGEFQDIKDVKRLSIAPVCPYWSPLVPSQSNLDILNDTTILEYKGLNNITYKIYKRKSGCGYYGQFLSYVESDVLIFNSEKYKIETLMNRKPATEVEIIDECDDFLDNFANYKTISINRLSFALSSVFSDDERINQIISELIELTRTLPNDEKINSLISTGEIVNINDTNVLHLLKLFLDSNLMNYTECDEENYCYHCDEVARTFENLLNETYVSFSKEDKELVIKLVTTNLEKRFHELMNKNKIIVMMSGTLHSPEVLKDIFGISDFKIIEAEVKMPGTISKLRTGLEINCKYENFKNGAVTREQYLKALDKCLQQAPRPVLVHVNSFNDLPSKEEIANLKLNLMPKGELIESQNKDKLGETVKNFKNKELDVLYSTKCNRGIDFPGEVCNSIILTKYPYPDVNSLFWKILRQTKPMYYSEFYRDKSKREFLQRIYRGLRSASDHIYLLSPDIRVFQENIS